MRLPIPNLVRVLAATLGEELIKLNDPMANLVVVHEPRIKRYPHPKFDHEVLEVLYVMPNNENIMVDFNGVHFLNLHGGDRWVSVSHTSEVSLNHDDGDQWYFRVTDAETEVEYMIGLQEDQIIHILEQVKHEVGNGEIWTEIAAMFQEPAPKARKHASGPVKAGSARS